MARTNATNFAGGLQFPYATAPTDLFHKEDVQTLALAVDQHTHAAGFGLPLAAGAIPNGTITSAMIADGTIVAGDIADGAITSAKIVADAIHQIVTLQPFGSFGPSSVSTTSPTFVNCAGLAITVNCTGGNLLTVVMGNLGSSSASSITVVGLKNDGSGPTLTARVAPLVANTASPFGLFAFWGPLSGSHTFQLAWQTSAGTATMDSINSFCLYAVEFKK